MATPLGNSVPYANSLRVDGLAQGSKWSSTSLTYSLWETEYGYWDDYSAGIIRDALNQYEQVSNLRFSYRPNNAYNDSGWHTNFSTDIELVLTGDSLSYNYSAYGLSIFPDPVFGNSFLAYEGVTRAEYPNIEGTTFLDNFQLPFQGGASPGGLGYSIILHELGHALGLKHPHDDGGNDRPTFADLGISGLDNELFTIMSYDDVPGSYNSTGHPQSLMPLDITAIQYIYGANMAWNAGNTTYYLYDDSSVETFWDAGGYDTFDASGQTLATSIDLEEAGYTFIGNTIKALAFNVLIEKAIGSNAGDEILGNYAANALYGNMGNDTINAGDGADYVRGGKNNDSLNGNQQNDFLAGDFDNDLVFGGQGNDTIRGGRGADSIRGDLGDDELFGDLDNDTLTGSDGADIFTFFSAGGSDTITDFISGVDKLRITLPSSHPTVDSFLSSVSYSGGARFTLDGAATVTLTGVTSLTSNDILIA